MFKKWTMILMAVLALAACNGSSEGQSTSQKTESNDAKVALLNVSYDVMRDFYKDYNPLFIQYYQEKNPNITINIQQSHGGSSKQALSVANGLAADVVTMNQKSDIELLQKKNLVESDWESVLPNNAVPFTSIVNSI